MKKIARVEDIPVGGTKLVFMNDTPIVLLNIKGKIQAWDNRCPHRGASLADGNILESTIQCKFHLWEFDIELACAVANSDIKVNTFYLEVQDGDIFIQI
jgi:3-phenylpropionate/trans-cinnamate dioxygenase ferredoxin subunit